MKIVILVEGKTEVAFLPKLREFVHGRIPAGAVLPKLAVNKYDGRLPKGDKLKKRVTNELESGADAVIALTDVYTGTSDFLTAADAKTKMSSWVNNPKFYPHAALHDFEAWLLPYWEDIKRLAGGNLASPGPHPENVNHNNPPSKRLTALFRQGGRRDYSKTRDAAIILKGQDILKSANACPELKEFLNRILSLSGGTVIP